MPYAYCRDIHFIDCQCVWPVPTCVILNIHLGTLGHPGENSNNIYIAHVEVVRHVERKDNMNWVKCYKKLVVETSLWQAKEDLDELCLQPWVWWVSTHGMPRTVLGGKQLGVKWTQHRLETLSLQDDDDDVAPKQSQTWVGRCVQVDMLFHLTI